MTNHSRRRLTMLAPVVARALVLAIAAQTFVGCSRFVWHEEPFTPDPAPATEVLASERDTTYVLRGSSYYLLARQRSALWNRSLVDDVAWRYRALFGEAPPLVAIRLDSAGASPDSTTWRGVALATAASGPMLAATVADAWLRARTLDATRTSDSQPGGPSNPSPPAARLPAWVEVGVLRILGSSRAADRAAAEIRASGKDVLPLARLFSVASTARPDAKEIVRVGIERIDRDDTEPLRGEARGRGRRDAASGVPPLFIAQSVSVLSFIRERDSSFVARLVDDLARGRTLPDVLAASAVLPHDIAGLDADWQKWVRRRARR